MSRRESKKAKSAKEERRRIRREMKRDNEFVPLNQGGQLRQRVRTFSSGKEKGSLCVGGTDVYIVPRNRATFARLGENVNPGNQNMFKWLSAIANHFETYEFEELIFEFVPSVPATEQGVFSMYLDYDASDENDPPESIVEIRTNQDAIVVPAWQHGTIRARKGREGFRGFSEKRYVRAKQTTPPAGANETNLFYDIGTFWFAQDGYFASDTEDVGFILVHYKVHLFTQHLPKEELAELSSASFYTGIGVTQANPCGTSVLNNEQTEINVVKTEDVSSFLFPNGFNGQVELNISTGNTIQSLTNTVSGIATKEESGGALTWLYNALFQSDSGFNTGTGIRAAGYMSLAAGGTLSLSLALPILGTVTLSTIQFFTGRSKPPQIPNEMLGGLSNPYGLIFQSIRSLCTRTINVLGRKNFDLEVHGEHLLQVATRVEQEVKVRFNHRIRKLMEAYFCLDGLLEDLAQRGPHSEDVRSFAKHALYDWYKVRQPDRLEHGEEKESPQAQEEEHKFPSTASTCGPASQSIRPSKKLLVGEEDWSTVAYRRYTAEELKKALQLRSEDTELWKLDRIVMTDLLIGDDRGDTGYASLPDEELKKHLQFPLSGVYSIQSGLMEMK